MLLNSDVRLLAKSTTSQCKIVLFLRSFGQQTLPLALTHRHVEINKDSADVPKRACKSAHKQGSVVPDGRDSTRAWI